MNKKYYLNLRNLYHPDNLRYIFILESPPVSGLYFYDKNGKTSEPLFAELMKFLKISVGSKSEGLNYFTKSGYLLVDATYQPVNELKGKERDKTILNDFDNLVEDLGNINPDKTIYKFWYFTRFIICLQGRSQQAGIGIFTGI